MKQFPEGGWANQESGLPQSAGAETRILFRSQHVVDFLCQLCHFLEILLEGRRVRGAECGGRPGQAFRSLSLDACGHHTSATKKCLKSWQCGTIAEVGQSVFVGGALWRYLNSDETYFNRRRIAKYR